MIFKKLKENLNKILKSYILSFAVFILGVLLFSQCREASVNPSDESRDQIRELGSLEKRLVEADNTMGFKILSGLVKTEKDKNIFLAPASISFALAMAYNGANGSTRQAIQTVLGLDGFTQNEVNQNFKSLMELLQNIDSKVRFNIANSVWFRKDYILEDSFLNNCKKYFNAEVSGLDFNKSDAASTINKWVENNTNGKIKEIVGNPIGSDLIMFIINAIYFKGSWTYRFEEDRTKDDKFYLPDGSNKNCRMMSQSARYLYYSSTDFQAIDIPYGNGAFSMTILLPNQGKDIDNFIDQLTRSNFEDIISKLGKDSVNLFIPKFKLEYDILLNNVLQSLGMGIVFTDQADFTNMYKHGGICISYVKHKTFIDVNEEGTEAAGVTAIGFITTSVREQPKVMYVNRPFVFIIRENNSKTILFLGKIVEPKY
jgi:serine protease inhibitor